MTIIRASDVAKRRLTLASRRLGTKNPIHAIGGLLDKSFHLPVGDVRYGDNALTPGFLPLEHSFSELSSNTLRLDMEPLGPFATPSARHEEAGREMRRLVAENFGGPALHWFDERSEPWRKSHPARNARFGAWFGMGTDIHGINESKVYYELRPGDIDNLPPNLQHAARIAMDVFPQLVPIFVSISCGRQRGSIRVYFYFRGDLKLIELQPLLHRLGIGHQHANLLATLGVILGGRFTLPEGSVIIGLRDTYRGIEMKLDVLLAALPDPPPQMYQLVKMAMSERPRSQTELSRWVQAMTPDSTQGPGHISVVSFRVQPRLSTRCSIYLRPTGYDQEGRIAEPPQYVASEPQSATYRYSPPYSQNGYSD
ncbi:MAG: hypothetical protein JXA30_22770 [Deltaproteobacteria bacterium]|nr:hypothetical protein [Deltaproteobacteria bacterium]